jgi:hypothetical protein
MGGARREVGQAGLGGDSCVSRGGDRGHGESMWSRPALRLCPRRCAGLPGALVTDGEQVLTCSRVGDPIGTIDARLACAWPSRCGRGRLSCGDLLAGRQHAAAPGGARDPLGTIDAQLACARPSRCGGGRLSCGDLLAGRQDAAAPGGARDPVGTIDAQLACARPSRCGRGRVRGRRACRRGGRRRRRCRAGRRAGCSRRRGGRCRGAGRSRARRARARPSARGQAQTKQHRHDDHCCTDNVHGVLFSDCPWLWPFLMSRGAKTAATGPVFPSRQRHVVDRAYLAQLAPSRLPARQDRDHRSVAVLEPLVLKGLQASGLLLARPSRPHRDRGRGVGRRPRRRVPGRFLLRRSQVRVLKAGPSDPPQVSHFARCPRRCCWPPARVCTEFVANSRRVHRRREPVGRLSRWPSSSITSRGSASSSRLVLVTWRGPVSFPIGRRATSVHPARASARAGLGSAASRGVREAPIGRRGGVAVLLSPPPAPALVPSPLAVAGLLSPPARFSALCLAQRLHWTTSISALETQTRSRPRSSRLVPMSWHTEVQRHGGMPR